MEQKNVSRNLLKRMPVYLNFLKSLPDDTVYISAVAIANALELGSVMVRKDLAKVSSGGRRKLGYSRVNLIRDIEEFLNFSKPIDAVVLGAGRLGQALLDYHGFKDYGLNVRAGFDVREELKSTAAGKPVYDLDLLGDFCTRYPVRIGIITVPTQYAQDACDRLVACGIKVIWNFTPVNLQTPGDVVVQDENLAESMTSMRMLIKESSATEE